VCFAEITKDALTVTSERPRAGWIRCPDELVTHQDRFRSKTNTPTNVKSTHASPMRKAMRLSTGVIITATEKRSRGME
jgi:hypothetical protein